MPRGAIAYRASSPAGGTSGFVTIATAFEPNFNALAVDQTVAAPTSVDLCTISRNFPAAHIWQIWSSWACQSTAGGVGVMRLIVDGVQVQAAQINGTAIAPVVPGAINWQATLAAGARTVILRISAVAGVMFIRPIVGADVEFANLTVNVLNV